MLDHVFASPVGTGANSTGAAGKMPQYSQNNQTILLHFKYYPESNAHDYQFITICYR